MANFFTELERLHDESLNRKDSDPSDERDGDGLLTDYALAFDALQDHGCDCGTDEPETCLACVCQRALMTERRAREQAEERARVAEGRLRTLDRLCFCHKLAPFANIEAAADAWAAAHPEVKP